MKKLEKKDKIDEKKVVFYVIFLHKKKSFLVKKWRKKDHWNNFVGKTEEEKNAKNSEKSWFFFCIKKIKIMKFLLKK